jgi:hypothetical protein
LTTRVPSIVRPAGAPVSAVIVPVSGADAPAASAIVELSTSMLPNAVDVIAST